MSKPLPHSFAPSQAAVEQTLSAHPSGAIELFMLAVNLESDIKLDTRLAASGYLPTIEAPVGVGVKKEGSQSLAPFAVPIVRARSASSAAPLLSGILVKQEKP